MALVTAGDFDATRIQAHTFPMRNLSNALHHAREWLGDVIELVASMRDGDDVANMVE